MLHKSHAYSIIILCITIFTFFTPTHAWFVKVCTKEFIWNNVPNKGLTICNGTDGQTAIAIDPQYATPITGIRHIVQFWQQNYDAWIIAEPEAPTTAIGTVDADGCTTWDIPSYGTKFRVYALAGHNLYTNPVTGDITYWMPSYYRAVETWDSVCGTQIYEFDQNDDIYDPNGFAIRRCTNADITTTWNNWTFMMFDPRVEWTMTIEDTNGQPVPSLPTYFNGRVDYTDSNGQVTYSDIDITKANTFIAGGGSENVGAVLGGHIATYSVSSRIDDPVDLAQWGDYLYIMQNNQGTKANATIEKYFKNNLTWVNWVHDSNEIAGYRTWGGLTVDADFFYRVGDKDGHLHKMWHNTTGVYWLPDVASYVGDPYGADVTFGATNDTEANDRWIYVNDKYDKAVYRFWAKNGTYLDEVFNYTAQIGTNNYCYGLTVNNIYAWLVCKQTGNTVKVYQYTLDGDYIDYFDTYYTTLEPRGIETDGTYFWIIFNDDSVRTFWRETNVTSVYYQNTQTFPAWTVGPYNLYATSCDPTVNSANNPMISTIEVTQAGTDTATFQFSVTDGDTGEPIDNINVFLWNQKALGSIVRGTTGADGRFIGSIGYIADTTYAYSITCCPTEMPYYHTTCLCDYKTKTIYNVPLDPGTNYINVSLEFVPGPPCGWQGTTKHITELDVRNITSGFMVWDEKITCYGDERYECYPGKVDELTKRYYPGVAVYCPSEGCVYSSLGECFQCDTQNERCLIEHLPANYTAAGYDYENRELVPSSASPMLALGTIFETIFGPEEIGGVLAAFISVIIFGGIGFWIGGPVGGIFFGAVTMGAVNFFAGGSMQWVINTIFLIGSLIVIFKVVPTLVGE